MIEHDPALALALSGFCVLLVLLATIRHFSQRSLLPPESWALLLGLIYGIVQRYFPALPLLVLSPDLVILLLLPILIFASARNLPPGQLLAESLPIAFFATIGVLVSLVLIGVPLLWIMPLGLLDALLFAASVAATDPSAVAAIFQRFPIPEKLAALLEGESLLNDATAIVAFLVIASLVFGNGPFMLGDSLGQFAWTLLAAVPLGGLLGAACGKLVAWWGEHNRFAGISLTLALAYGSFLLAEKGLHVSGVVTVMFAAWAFIRMRGPAPDHRGKELYISLWDYLSQLAGGILFFALGVTAGHHDFPINWSIPAVILILLASRAALIYGGGLLLRLAGQPLPAPWQHVMLLGGLRGAVSAALVLMIPEDYVFRTEMLCLVLVLCLYTLLIHPPLLHFYLKREPFGRSPGKRSQ